MSAPAAPVAPRRFRRRLVALMLAAGLAPVLVWALASQALAERVLAVSLEPLEEVLDRVDEKLARDPQAAALVAELTEARLHLAQAELGRRSLRRLAPWGYAAVVAASGGLLVAAALLFARAQARKLEGLAESAARYAAGELAHRAPVPAVVADEVDELVVRFNEMGEKLEAQRRRLETTEALAAWQEVARTMAHDLKNPLTAMRLSVARLGRQGELVEALEGELAVLLRMTESFAEFAKLPAPARRPLELGALVDEVAALYGVTVAAPRPAAPITITGDADQLRRALGNLVKNALEATPAGAAPVELTLAQRAHAAVVTVRDHGPGVPAPLDGAKLVRTLGTTKPGGSGLGLPIAAKIVHEHAGSLRLEPAPGGGARAIVELPA